VEFLYQASKVFFSVGGLKYPPNLADYGMLGAQTPPSRKIGSPRLRIGEIKLITSKFGDNELEFGGEQKDHMLVNFDANVLPEQLESVELKVTFKLTLFLLMIF